MTVRLVVRSRSSVYPPGALEGPRSCQWRAQVPVSIVRRKITLREASLNQVVAVTTATTLARDSVDAGWAVNRHVVTSRCVRLGRKDAEKGAQQVARSDEEARARARPAAEADEPPLPPLLRTAIVMVGALLLAVSSGSKLRVEMACETGALLEGTRFCAWSPGRRIQVCAALFAAVFLFDIVLVVLYSVIEAVVAVARAACRAPSAFADLAHEALVEWRRRRKAAARRNRQALRDAEADKERRAERKREAEATWRARARAQPEESPRKAQEEAAAARSAPPKPKPKPKATVPPESERHQTPPATPPEPKREIESDAGVLEHKGTAEALDAGVPESKSTPSEYEGATPRASPA